METHHMAASAGPSTRQIVDLYLGDLTHRASAMHLANVRSALERLLAVAPDLAPPDLIAWRSAAKAERKANRTINLTLGAARTCMRWAVSMGLVPAGRLINLPPLPQREADLRRRRRALTDDEIRRLLAVAERLDRGEVVPQAPLWRTLIETGLRFGEVSALRPCDLVRDTLHVRPATAKSGRTRRVPIPPMLARELRRIGKGHGTIFRTPSGRPWTRQNHTAASSRFRETLRQAGIRQRDVEGRVVDIHSLRVTACSRMLRRGVPLALVARVLGHADARLTMRVYADLAEIDIRRALRKTWRKNRGVA